jgi:hypothetical protein
MSQEVDDPQAIANIKRMADSILQLIKQQPVSDVQIALANIVAHVALAQGAEQCDRLFLETLDQMFSIYRQASNARLRNEDKAVS